MEKKYILAAFGTDRPGIVAGVTQVIYESGCNLEDSAMTRLADQFTMIVLFAGREEGLEERLSMECRRLEIEKGITAFIRPLSGEKVERREPFSTHTFHVEGIDQAGIVYKISKYLADNNVNIANLHSTLTPSPESGSAIYTMEIQAEVPEITSLDDLHNGLIQIGDELNVEVTFE
jgi:glycine cleavage system transcriptional repressor